MTDAPDQLPDASWRKRFRRRIGAWYAKHARDLPWRRLGDAYPIWLSEVMLQQTQVGTVGPYFERFLAAFPTVGDLAAAAEHEVLRLWEGLGYYRRARQLHEAARVIVGRHGGRFPRTLPEVLQLPGVGRYTAGAILSIAFDQRQPILEANTTRLFARLLAYRGAPTSAAGQRLLWAMAEAVLPRRGPGVFNQALMELGSEVCLPRGPRCPQCPVAPLCRARAERLQTEIPPAKTKPAFEDRHEAAVLVRRRGRWLLVQCPEGGRWAGLWDFPRFAVAATQPEAIRGELIDGVRRLTGVTVEPGERLRTIRHGVTRFRITLDCFRADFIAAGAAQSSGVKKKWLRGAELEDYPLSTTGRTMARLAAKLNGPT
jgi:A/G-specific adenine glycosylase